MILTVLSLVNLGVVPGVPEEAGIELVVGAAELDATVGAAEATDGAGFNEAAVVGDDAGFGVTLEAPGGALGIEFAGMALDAVLLAEEAPVAGEPL
jgi:hypothetical protein